MNGGLRGEEEELGHEISSTSSVYADSEMLPLVVLALSALRAAAVDPADYSPLLPAPLSQSNGSVTLGVSSSLAFEVNCTSAYDTRRRSDTPRSCSRGVCTSALAAACAA